MIGSFLLDHPAIALAGVFGGLPLFSVWHCRD